jgi:hypothetical protein
MARKIGSEHGATAVRQAARGKGPDDMVHARAMEHDHRGPVGCKRPPAGGGENRLAVDAKLHA